MTSAGGFHISMARWLNRVTRPRSFVTRMPSAAASTVAEYSASSRRRSRSIAARSNAAPSTFATAWMKKRSSREYVRSCRAPRMSTSVRPHAAGNTHRDGVAETLLHQQRVAVFGRTARWTRPAIHTRGFRLRGPTRETGSGQCEGRSGRLSPSRVRGRLAPEPTILRNLADDGGCDFQCVRDKADRLLEEQWKVSPRQRALSERGDHGMATGGVVHPTFDADRGDNCVVAVVFAGRVRLA